MENENTFETRTDLSELNKSVEAIRAELAKVIIGQARFVDLLLTAILANGHVLIEGVPGVAKTLTAKLLAKSIDADFSRIQFTPDLMPSDITGTSIYNTKLNDFEFKKGPVFSNIVLIDEINRSPAKTQAALFEIMEERQITFDGEVYHPGNPFIVFATQNPIEHEGTYRLPEAQLDRFLFKIDVDYPSLEEEEKILFTHHKLEEKDITSDVNKVLTKDKLIEFQSIAKKVVVEDNLLKYIAKLINSTRNNNSIFLGASPRASVNILNAAKAMAVINARDFVTPEDIKEVIFPVLSHRITLTPEKEMEGVSVKDVISQLISAVEVPR
jgi:MoxR-like ATPase